jgi:hypothetical protein
MSMGEMFKVAVEITAIDHLTRPMKLMEGSMLSTHNSIKEMNKTLKLMGASGTEIKAMTRDLQRLGDTRAFSGIAKDLKAIGRSSEEIALIEQSFNRMRQHQRELNTLRERYNNSQQRMISGAMTFGAGVMVAGGIYHGMKELGDFQDHLTAIQSVTGETQKGMDGLSNSIMNASAVVSKFNDIQMAGFAQQIATGGFNKTSQINQLLVPMAKFAEVQAYEHKASNPEESINQAIEMAHMFKHYDTKGAESFLNKFNKYSLMQPGSSTQLQDTLKYLAPMAFRTMHMSEDSVMQTAALANTMGLSGSHGGTNGAYFLMYLVPGLKGGMGSKKKTPKALAAMKELGFVDKNGTSTFFDSKGNLKDISNIVNTLIKDTQKYKGPQLTTMFHDIFGLQGGRFASIFTDPSTLERLQATKAQMGTTKDMNEMHKAYQGNLNGQVDLLKSNSMSLLLRTMKNLIGPTQSVLKYINGILGTLLKMGEQHPKIMKYIALGAAMASGLLIAGGAFKMIHGAIGMAISGLRIFWLTFGRLVISAGKWALEIAADWLVAMGPVGWIIAGVTAIIAVGVLMWKKNFLGFKDGLIRIWKDIKQIFFTYIQAWADYGKIFVDLFTGHFGRLKQDFMNLVKDLLGIFKPVTDIFSTIGKGGKNLWNWAKGGSENIWNWATGGGHNSGPTHKSGNTTNHYNINVNSNNGKQFAQDFHKETRKLNMNTSPYPTYGAMP